MKGMNIQIQEVQQDRTQTCNSESEKQNRVNEQIIKATEEKRKIASERIATILAPVFLKATTESEDMQQYCQYIERK